MSLIRKASKQTLRLTTEDFSACMDQKNGVIASLQGEVEALRTNQ
jgi:chromosome segregation ATPase